MARIDIYQMVTQRILDQMDKGIIPWHKPWNGSQPINYITRKPYRGVNPLLLLFGGEYLTFLQCKQLGGNVRKGEKSSMIVFYKPLEVIEEQADGKEKAKTIPYLQYSNVFHISQCDGIQSKLKEIVINETEPIEQAQEILDGYIERSGVSVRHVLGNHRAYYEPENDRITMPETGQFVTTEAYYGTAFHEAVHSTGHKTRLNRITNAAAFGSETYSKEELVAEIGSAMVMNAVNVEIPQTFENSIAYIQSWKKAIENDSKVIVTAASAAQKAADMILSELETEGDSAWTS